MQKLPIWVATGVDASVRVDRFTVTALAPVFVTCTDGSAVSPGSWTTLI